VHTILRDVSFSAGSDEVLQLAQFHGRTLEVPEKEVTAAVDAVRSALEHPLLKRAARAERVYRELPLLWTMAQGEIVEGTLDLAFRSARGWQVIDFKTDARIESERIRYETQLKWYGYGLKQITGEDAEGWLLGI
jgi:ATP-dependent exoDNAse (exonuclease V) beta subunit